MTNKEIYKKTLCFSLRKLLFDTLTVILLVALTVGGFVLLDKTTGKGLIGLAIGFVIGIIVIAIVTRFVSYALKAGQIAMMTKGITEGQLPDNVYQEGKKAVKERFATVAGFFALTSLIKGIFNQLGRGITALGNAIGGDTGGAVGSAISSAIQVIVAYLCDCCLGWVFYRKEQKTVKATLEGAVLFFKHGKTFAKNAGRIFGMGLASFAAIGGAFFGLTYLICMPFKNAFQTLSAEIVEAGIRNELDFPDWFSNPTILTIVFAAIIGILLWSIIHSTFIRPFILTGVLRNYLVSGMEDLPTEESFSMIEGKFSKAKLERYTAKYGE